MEEKFGKVILAHTFYGVLSKLTSIFGVIFFFNFFDNDISKVLLLFGIIYLATGLISLVWIKLIAFIGTNYSAALGIIFLEINFIFLFLFDIRKDYLTLTLYTLTLIVGRSFYMMSSHLYISESLKLKNIGARMGGLATLWYTMSIIVPLIAGFSSDYFGSISLIVLGLIATIPGVYLYLSLPKIKFNYTFKLKNIFNDRSLNKIHETSFWGGLRNPFLYIWPIWIYIQLNDGFKALGIFTTLLTILSILILRSFGKSLDKHNKLEALHTLGFAYGIEQILKFFSFNYVILIISDLYSRTISGLFSVAYDSYLYELFDHRDQENLIDERVAVREFTYNILVGLVMFLLAILFLYYPINYSFILSGILYIIAYIFVELFIHQRKSHKKI